MATVGVLALGCTTPEAADDLDASTAEELAEGAERLAAALDADDSCVALTEADELERRVRAAGEAGDAPDEVVTETVRVAASLTADLRCDPAEPDEPDEPDEPPEADGPDDAPEADGPAGNGGGDEADGGPPGGGPPSDRGNGPPAGRGQGQGPG